MREPLITRRRLIGRGAGAAAALGLGSLFAACGSIAGTDEQSLKERQDEAARVNHPRVPLGDWVFANWALYMDKALLKQFDARYGGHVKHVEEINDNNDFYAKVRQQLSAGVTTGRDLAVLSDWLVARMIRSGQLTPIDRDNVPNAVNLVDTLAHPSWDPRRQYSLPTSRARSGSATTSGRPAASCTA